MGLSNFPSAAEGVLPVLVMNTVMSVAILKNLLRSILELMGATTWVSTRFNEAATSSTTNEIICSARRRARRDVSVKKFRSSNVLVDGTRMSTITISTETSACDASTTTVTTTTTATTAVVFECCVCLSRFEEEEEVSELSCKHFFHKKCLDKWFDNHHTTCPLCRSIH